MPHLSLPPAPPILHSLLPLVLLILPGEAGPDAALGRSSLTQPEANHEPDVTLEAGYPGWEAPTFKRAASEPQGRFLYYRKTPKVDKYRSAVHELYMRPYNYVSYEMGGSKPTQYQYHYLSPASYSSSPLAPPPPPPAPSSYPQYNYYAPSGGGSSPSAAAAAASSAENAIAESGYSSAYSPPYYSPSTYAPPPAAYSFHHASPTPVPTHHSHSPSYPTPSSHHSYHASPTPPPYGLSTPLPVHGPTYQPTFLLSSPSSPSPPPSPADQAEAYLTHHAVAVLTSPDDAVSGVLHFYQVAGPTSPVHVVGNVTGLSPGLHGFHIHQLGDLSGGCKSTAGHFNPYQVTHGAPFDQYRHAGDLGNILANKAGLAQVDITDRLISLNGINSILGRGLVLHAGEDDLGRGGDDGSLKTGNAGGRVACAVIGHAADAV